MKLSEAIRLGAMAVPPRRGPFWLREKGDVCGACAMGAALYAVCTPSERAYWIDNGIKVDDLKAKWPMTAVHPLHPLGDESVVSIIINLFEVCLWSREQIADWVETIEPRDLPAVDSLRHESIKVTR